MPNFETPQFYPEQPQKGIEQKESESRSYERDLVLSNPEFVGINFDQDYIVDGRKLWSEERYLQYVQERDGGISDQVRTMIDLGQSQVIIADNKEKEALKQNSFQEYLSSFEGKLKHVRIHPGGEFSPITPSQAIKINSDGTFDVGISPEFIEQVKMLQEQADDVTLVVQFYDHRRGAEKASDVPETEEQTKQYIALCEGLIDRLGNNIQLEIGNETNISRASSKRFADKLQHASRVDATEYSTFFYEVARTLKEKSPTVKLSIAGVASFDPTYLDDVLAEVKRLQDENGIKTPLADTISFHPYRSNAEAGSSEVKNGTFMLSELTYQEQLKAMQDIASKFEVKLTVGEINFPLTDPEQKEKLKQAIHITSDTNIETLIYPGVNVH